MAHKCKSDFCGRPLFANPVTIIITHLFYCTKAMHQRLKVCNIEVDIPLEVYYAKKRSLVIKLLNKHKGEA